MKNSRPDLLRLGKRRHGITQILDLAMRVILAVNFGRCARTTSARVTYPANLAPTYVSIADMDHDGDLDLVIANNVPGFVSILSNLGYGTFAAPVTYATDQYPFATAIADFDEDGDLDFAVPCWVNDVLYVFMNLCHRAVSLEDLPRDLPRGRRRLSARTR